QLQGLFPAAGLLEYRGEACEGVCIAKGGFPQPDAVALDRLAVLLDRPRVVAGVEQHLAEQQLHRRQLARRSTGMQVAQAQRLGLLEEVDRLCELAEAIEDEAE